MADGLLTRPERAAEIGLARRKLIMVKRAGGCGVCKHAIHGWGRSACDTPGRIFPRCMSTPGKQFDIDHTKLKGNPNASSK